VIRVEGELDLSSAPTLEASLADAERFHRGRIVVDLDGLSFIDSHGLQTLLDLTLPFTEPVAAPVSEVVEEGVGS
jgi:anti-anti-sigma factor